MGERTGATAADSMKTNNGSIVGGVTLGAPGAIATDSDSAMTFDGKSGYVGVPSSSSLNLSGDLTIEAWARPQALDSTLHSVVEKASKIGPGGLQYRLTLDSTNVWRGCLDSGSKESCLAAPTKAVVGQWSHLVLTRSGSLMTLYVNGQSVATSTFAGSLTTTTGMLSIGRAGGVASRYFAGSVDEVSVYNKALSASRVLAHYNAAH
jgi:Concanavalin A-like lectin/glucanases superfamily